MRLAQRKLGWAYDDGVYGLKIDMEMALMWLHKAAKGGDGSSQWRLGVAYEGGELSLSLVTEKEEALEWFKAAAGGDLCATQLRLAGAYERGELGLVTDEEEALKWHRKRRRMTNNEKKQTSRNGGLDAPTKEKSWAW